MNTKKKPVERFRGENVMFKLTKEEKENFQKKASEFGMTMSEYIRWLIVNSDK